VGGGRSTEQEDREKTSSTRNEKEGLKAQGMKKFRKKGGTLRI
jgi:hypothetical protein